MTYVKSEDKVLETIIANACCFLGCYITTCFCEQYRLLCLGQHVSKMLHKNGLFAMMTLSLGGVAMYAMYALNLAGLTIKVPDGSADGFKWIDIEFKAVPQVLALISALILSFCGLYVASHDVMFAKSKKQIIESFIADAKNLSFAEIRAFTPYKMFYIISTQKLWFLVTGGILAGSGAALTSALSLWSMALSDLDVIWQPAIVVTMIVAMWLTCIVAFWIMFRLLSLYPRYELLRIVSTALLTGGFIFSYYVGVACLKLRVHLGAIADDTVQTTGNDHFTQQKGFMVLLAFCAIFIVAMMMVSITDLRSWLYESSARLHKLELLLTRLKVLSGDNQTIISKYMHSEASEAHQHGNQCNTSAKEHSFLEKSVASVSATSKFLMFMRGKVSPTETSSRSGSPSRSNSRGRPLSSNIASIAEAPEEAAADSFRAPLEPLSVRVPETISENV